MGTPVALLFNTIILSLMVTISVLIVVVDPDTVKLPLTVTSLNVTLEAVPTAWPIAIVGVAVSPVLFVIVTPVP